MFYWPIDVGQKKYLSFNYMLVFSMSYNFREACQITKQAQPLKPSAIDGRFPKA